MEPERWRQVACFNKRCRPSGLQPCSKKGRRVYPLGETGDSAVFPFQDEAYLAARRTGMFVANCVA